MILRLVKWNILLILIVVFADVNLMDTYMYMLWTQNINTADI
jgi:hypothetical protein